MPGERLLPTLSEVQAQVEKTRERVRSRIEELRSGKSSGRLIEGKLLEGKPLEKLEAKFPVIKDIREKGVLATAREKFPILERGRIIETKGKVEGKVSSEAAIANEAETRVKPRRTAAIAT